jgi:hypothetical protein
MEEPPKSPELKSQKSKSGAGPYTCLGCGDMGFQSDAHLNCPSEDVSHSMCLTCFGVFVKHCCEEAVSGMANSLPIKCSLCQSVIPIHQLVPLIRRYDLEQISLAGDKIDGKTLMDIYERADLQVGLGSVADDNKESILSCHLCGQYVEVFVPMEKDYWSKLERKRIVAIEDYKIRMAQKLSQDKQKYEAIVYPKQVSVLQKEVIKVRGQLIREYTKIFKADRDRLLRKVMALDDSAALQLSMFEDRNSFAYSKNEGDPDYLEEVLNVFTESKVSELCTNARAAVELDPAFNGLQELALKDAQIRSEIVELAGERVRKRLEMEKQHAEEVARTLKIMETTQDAKMLSNVDGSDAKLEQSESTKFFVCKKAGCPGAMCMACNERFEKDSIFKHVCVSQKEIELYLEVIDILAKASTRVCPECQFPGMKDLACAFSRVYV